MSDRTDEELEIRFLKDPEAELEAVYQRYSAPLIRYLYRFTSNREGAEEILQDIFIELLKGKYRWQESGTLKSWIYTVAKNRGLSHLKKSSREVMQDFNQMENGDDLENESISKNLFDHLNKSEIVLPIEIKETWELRKKGFDNQEIARVLDIPLGTVKSRFSRLVDYLKKEFGT